MPASTIKTFNLVSPKDMLEKLRRELQRMKNAQSAQELADHAVNYMITAYHLVDWTWHGRVEDSTELRTRFNCTEHNVTVANAPKDPGKRRVEAKWLYWKWLERQCAALEGCRQIANGSKHFRLESVAPEIVSVSVTAKSTPPDSGFWTLSATDNYTKYLVVKTRYSNGNFTTDDQYIEPVLHFWERFFRENQFD